MPVTRARQRALAAKVWRRLGPTVRTVRSVPHVYSAPTISTPSTNSSAPVMPFGFPAAIRTRPIGCSASRSCPSVEPGTETELGPVIMYQLRA